MCTQIQKKFNSWVWCWEVGELFYYHYYYCAYFKLPLCLQVRIVVKLQITIIWAISYRVSNRLMLHLPLWKAFTISQFCALTHFSHFLIMFILSESPTLFNLWISSQFSSSVQYYYYYYYYHYYSPGELWIVWIINSQSIIKEEKV